MAILDVKVPTVGESVTEVTIARWLKGNGEFVKRDEAICEFESDKATLELAAEQDGVLTHVAAEGDDVAVGAIIATLDTAATGGNAVAPVADAPKNEVKTETPKAENKDSYASGTPSPAAKKLIDEKGLDSTDIKGTGKDGRITKEDALNATPKAKEEPKTETKTAPVAAPAAPATAFSREVRREKLSRMRRTIASRLVSAKNNTAMLTTFNEMDMTGINELRAKYQDGFVAKYGIKLGFMSLFAKACAKVLMEMPDVNASLDGDNIVYHNYADISIAVSTPTGLVVPPVHNVESLSFADVEKKIKVLADKARTGSLTLEEMSGGTFTITNGGVFGSLMSTPILNEPQSAILGMHSIKERPIVVNGEIKIRPMMYLALSYDHRVIDGSTSVTFLVKVKELLEDPTKLLLL